MKTDVEYDELNLNDINSILNFITENYIQIFLLILVFVIIYIVDCISNFNTAIFSIHSPIPVMQTQVKNEQIQKQEKNTRKNTRKNMGKNVGKK